MMTSAATSKLTRVRVDAGRAQGIELAGGEVVDADAVVLAPGAWAATLGASCGAALPLQPLRRHLAQLDPADPVDAHGPTVWALGVEVYFRPESGGVLASPCDEVPWPPSLPPTDANALETLAREVIREDVGEAQGCCELGGVVARTEEPDLGRRGAGRLERGEGHDRCAQGRGSRLRLRLGHEHPDHEGRYAHGVLLPHRAAGLVAEQDRFRLHRQQAEAEAILKKTLAPLKSVKKSWHCAGCGEEIEGQFSECWKCGRSRGDEVAPLDTVVGTFSIRNR